MKRWIRSRYGVHGFLAVVFLSAVTLIVATPHLVEGQSLGERETKAEPLDARTYAQVQSLREAVGLTNDDLATLDLSEEQAAGVISRLLEWTERNQKRLDAADAKQRSAARELRAAQRSLNVGPRDERLIRSLPSQSEAMAQARLEQRALQEEGGRQALAAVRSDQRNVWESVNARSNTQRLPSESQRQLAEDFRSAKQGRAQLTEAKKSSTAESPQLSSLRQARGNRLAGVQAAEERLLPIPDELAEAFDPAFGLDEDGQP